MLRKRFLQYIEESSGSVVLFPQEKEYAVKHGLLDADKIATRESDSRFEEAYIERCEKETEELIAQESFIFLNQPITYLKKHKNEFVFLELEWFNVIGVEAVSIEVDDVFGTYDAMLGLKLQKRYRSQIEHYLENTLKDESSYDLLFNGEDGLWDLNITLNDLPDFHEGLTMLVSYELIYDFLFHLLQTMDEA
ncbi:branched-chain amino acid aminotransferase [Bacillus sp. CH30_1T]|uniref:branched-chain amino acid aminotransferase n=1 Tax=Bacillus sp. CH30_1T TaxID=2604836 RepID=UPI0011F03D3D|nr:branched-chain amino acid aminotransferase [Bacillus sp. CH30_1T]KAA0564711.1 branched-chain amino acid aminotransferase [Bacillus sp. CH30_1T]